MQFWPKAFYGYEARSYIVATPSGLVFFKVEVMA
jgi:hypothetical protein